MDTMDPRLRNFYFVSIFSLFFAIVGFSYNAWRLEESEKNDNVRNAAFQILVELAEFEQILYLAYYDQNEIDGNPRKGWVKVGLVNDLGMLVDDATYKHAEALKALWSDTWQEISTDRDVVNRLVDEIDQVRDAVKAKIKTLS